MNTKATVMILVLGFTHLCRAGELPQGTKIPLTSRDLFATRNFHDAVSSLVSIRKLLNESGGRLNDNEVAILFSAYGRRSVFLRVNHKHHTLSFIGFDDTRNREGADTDMLNDGGPTDRWRIRQDESVVTPFVQITQWVAKCNQFDVDNHRCDSIPSIQIFVLSPEGISIIEHAPHNSILDSYVRFLQLIMSQRVLRMSDAQRTSLLRKEARQLSRTFDSELLMKTQSKPFRFLKDGGLTTQVGITEREFAEEVAK